MNLFPIVATALFWNHDGKMHLATGIALLVVMFASLILFDRLIIRRERHRYHPTPTSYQRHGIRHNLLQMIELFVSCYFCRPWKGDEPFRKATTGEKRAGACFMFFWPAALIILTTQMKSFDAFVDSMMYGRHWVGWLYVTVIAAVVGGVFFLILVAPKIPLKVSVPFAVLAWLTLCWVIWTHHMI